MGESAHLSLTEGAQDITSGVSCNPRSNEHQRVHSVESARLDEHCDDGFAQSTDSAYSHRCTNTPGVQDESDDDHEGEEYIE